MTNKEKINMILKLWAKNLFNGKTKSGKNFDSKTHDTFLPLLLRVADKEAGMKETEVKESLAEAMLDVVEDALKAEGLADDFLDDDFDDISLEASDSLDIDYDDM